MWYRPANSIRAAIAIVAVLGVFVALWWVPLVCMILLALRYPAWEVPVIGLLMDFLWLPGSGHFVIPLFMIGGIGIVWICAPLRDQFLT